MEYYPINLVINICCDIEDYDIYTEKTSSDHLECLVKSHLKTPLFVSGSRKRS